MNIFLRVTSVLLTVILLFLAVFLGYKYVSKYGVIPVFSVKDMLSSLWNDYKTSYIDSQSFRVIDHQRNNVTTSEGESYAMLRAVWMDDKESFDKSWQWTKKYLQKPDGLFSWLYGKRSNGTYGVLIENQGENSASDADTDIALSLLFAGARWQDQSYVEAAQNIIDSIWQREVIIINGRPYMSSDDLERNSRSSIVVNPSYLEPYAYRIFAQVDNQHAWNDLVDSSYEVLEKSISEPLDKEKSAYIPPNWILVDRSSGKISATTNAAYSSDYSYDALRVPWRLALDYEWNKEERALNLLKQMSFLDDEWNSNSVIHSDYAHDGLVVDMAESPAVYGGSLMAIRAVNPSHGMALYRKKLVTLFNPDSGNWLSPLGYYDDNWVWFSVALYNHMLPNLWHSSSSRNSY